MKTMNQLAKVIEAAGFDAFAVMPATPLNDFLPILEQAKTEERYPPFVDKDINKRINPQALQESAKSIISLAMSYSTQEPGPAPPLSGTLSRSAWGQDYHNVLARGMDKVIYFLQQYWGASKCTKAVDTSFLIDRALAIESGLGFPGSNCAVYVPPFGSWVFLGEILVDIELPVTKAATQNNWGAPLECDACVRACPTNALFAPGKINPYRCLSYLTQKTGSIPVEFRRKLGNRLWGCDTCQQACKINRTAEKGAHKEFEPIVGPHVPLIPLLLMDNQQFTETFGETSIAWRGKNVLQRNACYILGNQKNPEAVKILRATANDHPSPTVREAARWALQQY